jgi:hypothetical protein
MSKVNAASFSFNTQFAAIQQLTAPSASMDGNPLRDWQSKAFDHSTVIPELSFANRLIANTFSRGIIRAVEVKQTKRGVTNYVPTSNKKVLEFIQSIGNQFGGMSQVLFSSALSLSIAGEGHLIAVPRPYGGFDWTFVSPSEFVMSKDGFGKTTMYRVNELGVRSELPAGSFWARFWVPDVQHSDAPDSPIRHMMSVCDEVRVLSALINVIARSKIASGMFGVADELSFGYDETADESSEDDGFSDPFTRDYFTQLTSTLDDPGDVAAFVPLLVRGPKEFLPSKENFITFERPLDEIILKLRDDAVKRLVTGLDLPAELVTGKSGTSSWSGLSIDADFVSRHIEPLGILWASLFTRRVLHPFLEQMGVSDPSRFAVIYDTSEIAAKVDLGKTALELFDRQAISVDSLRRLSGVEEADGPDDTDFVRQVVLKLAAGGGDLARILLPLLPEFASVADEIRATDPGHVNAGSPVGVDKNDVKSAPPTERNSVSRKVVNGVQSPVA